MSTSPLAPSLTTTMASASAMASSTSSSDTGTMAMGNIQDPSAAATNALCNLTSLQGMPDLGKALLIQLVDPSFARQLLTYTIYMSVVLGLVIWDLISNLAWDITLVRKPGWTDASKALSRTAYVLARYGAFGFVLPSVLFYARPQSDCNVIPIVINVLMLISFSATTLVFLLRTIAIWRSDRRVLALLSILWLHIFAWNLVMTIESRGRPFPGIPTGIGAPQYCVYSMTDGAMSTSVIGFASAAVAFDLAVVLLTALKVVDGRDPVKFLRKRTAASQASAISHSLLLNGFIYLVASLTLTLYILIQTLTVHSFIYTGMTGLSGPTGMAGCALMAGFVFRATFHVAENETAMRSRRTDSRSNDRTMPAGSGGGPEKGIPGCGAILPGPFHPGVNRGSVQGFGTRPGLSVSSPPLRDQHNEGGIPLLELFGHSRPQGGGRPPVATSLTLSASPLLPSSKVNALDDEDMFVTSRTGTGTGTGGHPFSSSYDDGVPPSLSPLTTTPAAVARSGKIVRPSTASTIGSGEAFVPPASWQVESSRSTTRC